MDCVVMQTPIKTPYFEIEEVIYLLWFRECFLTVLGDGLHIYFLNLEDSKLHPFALSCKIEEIKIRVPCKGSQFFWRKFVLQSSE